VDDVRVMRAEAIERVYRETGERLWWALRAYTGDREMASDALAETLARALASSTPIDDPTAWVWRVAFRVATEELRNAPTNAVQDASSYEVDHEVLDVILALERLTPRQRASFILFYLDDRPTKEIAKLLGTSVATVSVHLHRARRRLRSILEDDDA
jgi:RNA polymerase sigma factor (sigma-70 family)